MGVWRYVCTGVWTYLCMEVCVHGSMCAWERRGMAVEVWERVHGSGGMCAWEHGGREQWMYSTQGIRVNDHLLQLLLRSS